MNITHPFGLPIWKPALYKKSRSVTRDANSALHSMPTSEIYLYPGNVLWAITFGWWLALISYFVSIFLYFTPFGGQKYARVLKELSYYIFWPFGKYVERVEDVWYDVFDDGTGEDHENDSRMDYEDGETERLLGSNLEYEEAGRPRRKRTGCGRLWDLGWAGLVFYFWFFLLIGRFLPSEMRI